MMIPHKLLFLGKCFSFKRYSQLNAAANLPFLFFPIKPILKTKIIFAEICRNKAKITETYRMQDNVVYKNVQHMLQMIK